MDTTRAAWDLRRASLSCIRRHHYEVAVLPVGAVEAHNRHLPEGMDVIHSEYVALTSCQKAWPHCQSVICLPAVPFGVDCNLMAFPLTVHVSQKVLDAYITEILLSLRKHGIRKVVIINGHGGNDFKPLARQIQYETDIYLFLCDGWKVGSDIYEEWFGKGDDHAGAMETSVAMEICPELVDPENAGDGRVPPFRFEAIQKGWITTSRDFSKLNDHCAVSSDFPPACQKGKQYLALVCDRISRFLAELANSKIDSAFPMQPQQ
ncbi:MAG TPA: creatininase family protein [Anaerohalosphaeraceae bacterium]|nr:creatininase family protein [Anaerohalosphaeraceae bacterium]